MIRKKSKKWQVSYRSTGIWSVPTAEEQLGSVGRSFCLLSVAGTIDHHPDFAVLYNSLARLCYFLMGLFIHYCRLDQSVSR